VIQHDVIVVGGGVAGLSAAIAAAGNGSVAIISKSHPLRSMSANIREGVNSCDDDLFPSLLADTIHAGEYLNDVTATESLLRDSGEMVAKLEEYGVAFTRDAEGSAATAQLQGASRAYTRYCSDHTGRAIINALWSQVIRCGVSVYDEWMATKLLLDESSVCGVVALDIRSGRVHPFSGRSVVIASGGYGGIFTDSAAGSYVCGDGLMMAYQAGASLSNMEFVDFHPAGLKTVDGMASDGAAIGDMAIALGARFLNSDGDEIDVGLKNGVLPPDHVMSSSLHKVAGDVTLDFTGIDKDLLTEIVPSCLPLLRSLTSNGTSGIRVPVKPVARRSIGGITVDNVGATGVPRLYAAGEAACSGVHGAGLLVGNSLLEDVASGWNAGVEGSRIEAGFGAINESETNEEQNRIENMLRRDEGTSSAALSYALRRAMTDGLGIIRSPDGMEAASQMVSHCRQALNDVALYDGRKRYNQELVRVLELGNMIEVAGAVITSAMAREESRGSHRRTDFAEVNDDKYQMNSEVSLNQGVGEVTFVSLSTNNLSRQEAE